MLNLQKFSSSDTFADAILITSFSIYFTAFLKFYVTKCFMCSLFSVISSFKRPTLIENLVVAI